MNNRFVEVVGIVGATGAVGQELVRLLQERNFPMKSLRLFASARSAGKTIECGGKKYTVEEAKPGVFAGVDLAFFAAGGSVTRALAKDAVAAGCLVIDKSSALRMEPNIPLVIPEINPEKLRKHDGIIANPNCSTAIMLMGLWPLHQKFGVKRVIISTYQSVSGTGAEAVRELEAQVQAHVKGGEMVKKVYPYQIAFNCIPQIDTFDATGYTGEETKMAQESRKIMGLPDLKVSATTVRVPVVRAHSISVSAEFERPVNIADARAAIEAFPGAVLVDDVANKKYPTPLDFAEKVKCGVGRLRIDTAFENGLSFWVSGDNLWKGAALNAVQNAELMIREGLLGAKS
ncbi:aspartate-semialdehyde dehydrogenase [Geminisphaera colitermitum]|uniref:aspartate-semialdehyde dehydrogenase n=1 Tax=Geminisphaera colitermitum TaxID=1148786 RepID=UPI0002E2E1CE|nr:aspartate-semialdehyde dehydrogenase [Geminisphaera colitermitum]